MEKRVCGEMAAVRFTWPGKGESHACIDCAMKVGAIANAISLPLQMIPLSYGANAPMPKEFPTCGQMVEATTPAVAVESGQA